MKYRLELNCLDDGRKFLNYWDSEHGNDVICEIVNGQLILSSVQGMEAAQDIPIPIAEFVQLVEATNVV